MKTQSEIEKISYSLRSFAACKGMKASRDVLGGFDKFADYKIKSMSTPISEDVVECESIVDKPKLSDFMDKIEDDKIGEYKYFTVYMDLKQYYLGRVFIWANRLDAKDEFELTVEEHLELVEIKKDLKAMYELTFQPDMINTAFLGNSMHHCHCHVVPRYKTERKMVVGDNTFCDENYGENYSRPNTKGFKISPETQNIIKEQLRSALQCVKNEMKLKHADSRCSGV